MSTFQETDMSTQFLNHIVSFCRRIQWRKDTISCIYAIILLCAGSETPLFAQGPPKPPEPFRIEQDGNSGGFGGAVFKTTWINNDFGWLVGGRGGWIVNHKTAFGVAGYNLVSDIEDDDFIPDQKVLLNMGYIGFETEYIALSYRFFHLSLSALFGIGGINFEDPQADEDIDENSLFSEDGNEADSFFVGEPGAQLQVNIAKHFRLSFGLSYRIVAGIDIEGVSNLDISGVAGSMALMFGWF